LEGRGKKPWKRRGCVCDYFNRALSFNSSNPFSTMLIFAGVSDGGQDKGGDLQKGKKAKAAGPGT
jgi:hypothetical protein